MVSSNKILAAGAQNDNQPSPSQKKKRRRNRGKGGKKSEAGAPKQGSSQAQTMASQHAGRQPQQVGNSSNTSEGKHSKGQGRHQAGPPGPRRDPSFTNSAQPARDQSSAGRDQRDKHRDRQSGRAGRSERQRERTPSNEPIDPSLPQQLRGRKLDKDKSEPPFSHNKLRYGLVIYDTFQAAKADLSALADRAQTVDQLNIVIRQEGDMDDPELNKLTNAKVFAGQAWTLIHERRQQDGWYDEPR